MMMMMALALNLQFPLRLNYIKISSFNYIIFIGVVKFYASVIFNY